MIQKNRKPGMVLYTCISSTWAMEAVGSGVQCQPQLYSDFEASKPSLSREREERGGEYSKRQIAQCQLLCTLRHLSQLHVCAFLSQNLNNVFLTTVLAVVISLFLAHSLRKYITASEKQACDFQSQLPSYSFLCRTAHVFS